MTTHDRGIQQVHIEKLKVLGGRRMNFYAHCILKFHTDLQTVSFIWIMQNSMPALANSGFKVTVFNMTFSAYLVNL
jgi:hypothetical protein